MLRRFGLQDRFEKTPTEALAALHHAFLDDGGEDRLFALAELSFLHAAESGDRAYYLAAAVYAYALIFPADERAVALAASDPRSRLACDLYNQGLAEGLRRLDRDELDVSPGPRRLPFGLLDLAVDPTGFTWLGYRLERFVPSASLAVRGLRNRYRNPGVGAAVVAGIARQEAAASVPGARRIGPGTRIPVTAFLRLDDLKAGLAAGFVKGRLELYAADQVDRVRVGRHELPLESDPTAALALWLEESPIWTSEMRGLFRLGNLNLVPTDRTDDGLFLLEPYRPDRIPLVLVHGTYSSPARWAELVNELRGDPELRTRYQIWLFQYDTGYAIGYSAGRLRRALERTIGELDPGGTAPALHRMVLIGHSQGGLLVKLTAVDSGSRFWDAAMKQPLETLDVDPDVRETVRRSMFFTPEPFVNRVVFLATPHHGSYLAGTRLTAIANWLLDLPGRILGRTFTTLTLDQERQILRYVERLPSSIDNMSPGNRFIRVLAPIPIASGVHVHSIIAVNDSTGSIEDGGDGVVQYRSAHIEGAESQLVVHSPHSVQGNPYAIEEIRRILRQHLR
jgi:hypothetical protein